MKKEQKAKRAKAQRPVQREPKEVLAELVEKLRGKLEVKATSASPAALVKKIVSGKVQFFPTNSTIQSWGCVKREKVLNPGGRWGLWNCARMRLTDEKGGAMGQASWRSAFLGQRSAKFLPETRVR